MPLEIFLGVRRHSSQFTDLHFESVFQEAERIHSACGYPVLMAIVLVTLEEAVAIYSLCAGVLGQSA